MNFNLHTHTHFCDGKGHPEDFIKEAIILGFHTLGFSSHAPVPFENNFSLKAKDLPEYRGTIRELGNKYHSDIQVLLALEIDYIPGITRSFSAFRNTCGLDYAIGGIHLVKNPEKEQLWFIDGPKQETYDKGLREVFDGNTRKGVGIYFNQLEEMIQNQKPDIIAHLDKIKMHNKGRYFSESEKWYKDHAWCILQVIKEYNCIVEVNTRGIYKKRSESLFPSPEILEQILHLGIPITMSSDAHQAQELNLEFHETVGLLKEIGFKELWYFDKKGRLNQQI